MFGLTSLMGGGGGGMSGQYSASGSSGDLSSGAGNFAPGFGGFSIGGSGGSKAGGGSGGSDGAAGDNKTLLWILGGAAALFAGLFGISMLRKP